MQAGILKAIEVPLSLMHLANSCWPHMLVIAEHGNITAISDIQVFIQTDILVPCSSVGCSPLGCCTQLGYRDQGSILQCVYQLEAS